MKNPDLLTDSYDYYLPKELIASRPIEGRSSSRLLVYHAKEDRVSHHKFFEIQDILNSSTTIVMNESKVFPCRLLGHKPTGGQCELFLLSLIHVDSKYNVLIKSSGKKKIGDEFVFDELKATITNINADATFEVIFNLSESELLNFLEQRANIPLPPYIREGVADEKDKEDYQTVYAKNIGSVAAPTAGLHFTKELIEQCQFKGIDFEKVTLHVGAGTFKPVVSDSILEHKMHSEYFEVDPVVLSKLQAKRDQNSPIIAVGTTSLRVLQSCYDKGFKVPEQEKPWSTNIFLYPGVDVSSIDGIITNFHLPKSTLIMLVSSLIGREKTLEIYKLAIKEKYRFYSYGDAMLILR